MTAAHLKKSGPVSARRKPKKAAKKRVRKPPILPFPAGTFRTPAPCEERSFWQRVKDFFRGKP